MMKTSLYPHQIEAIEKLQSGSILCGGVGTGKSRAAIGYYFSKELGGSILEDGWFDTPKKDIPLFIITTARKRDSLEWDKDLSVFYLSTNPKSSIFSSKVIVDSWNNIKKYESVTNAFFIFDEQRVVGYGSWVKSFIKIAKNNRWILLSATPGDTWMDYMPVFIANGFFKNKTDFIRNHVVYDRTVKFPKISRYLNTGKLETLRKKILVTMPAKRHTKRNYKALHSAYDRELYKKTWKERWDFFESKPIPNSSMLCHILRRIVNADLDKLDWLRLIINDHKKVIVFYNYTYELYILRRFATDLKISFGEYNGLKHEDIPNTDSWLYFVQYLAGAEGWNCVSTDTVVFYSLNYSYKIMEQASGRIDRINTEYKELYYYALYSHAQIDKAIVECLKNKKSFNESIFVKDF